MDMKKHASPLAACPKEKTGNYTGVLRLKQEA
jgi:hypothetical protein